MNSCDLIEIRKRDILVQNMSTLSLIPEEKKYSTNTSKSTESLYSSSSSKYSVSALYKRKMNAVRQPAFIPSHSEVRQRVLSARRLRMKTLQNQLTDAQQHIVELANENKILKTLHKRQDSALSKYEGTNAELPQLLHSHAEEIRMWQVKYRGLHMQNKELNRKLKEKDAMLLALGDQNKHLTQLSKDRNLEDRERLTERVRYLESRLSDKDKDLKLLSRRLQLESKNYSAQLMKEQNKYKQLIQKLEQGRVDTEKLNRLQSDIKERHGRSSMPRSLSGSKLPKVAKERRREERAHDASSNDTKTSFSTPSLCPEYQTVPVENEINSSKFLTNGVTKDPPKLKAAKVERISRQNSGARKSRRDQDNDYDSVDISNAIARGMSKLLCNDPDKDEVSVDGNEVPSDTDHLQDQSEPENYYDDEGDEDEEDDDDHYRNGDDFLGSDDNEGSVDIIQGNDKLISYESEEIVHKTRLEFASIQKQMADDYEQRESYLDSYCRQSSNVEKDSSIRKATNIDSKKKDQLLAALKAIETEESP